MQGGIPVPGNPNRWGATTPDSGPARYRQVGGQMAVYWSGTAYAPNPNNAWNFNTAQRSQKNDNKDNQNYGWAVRPGE